MTLPHPTEEDINRFVQAVQDGNNGAVDKALKQYGKNIVNEKNNKGYTALMEAAYWGREYCMHMLIQEGADLNSVNKAGATALMLSVLTGETAMTKILLEAGANIYIRLPANNKTALDIASSIKYDEIARLIEGHKERLEKKEIAALNTGIEKPVSTARLTLTPRGGKTP